MRKIHLVVGVAGALAFVLTGQYMHWELNHLRDMADGPRLVYRTTHIYLMWASVLNIALGCFLVQPRKGPLHVVQLLSSFAVLVGPILLCTSFFVEHFRPDLERPLARYANILAFAGMMGHLAVWMRSRQSSLEPA